jgi:hypothetical protein
VLETKSLPRPGDRSAEERALVSFANKLRHNLEDELLLDGLAQDIDLRTRATDEHVVDMHHDGMARVLHVHEHCGIST